MARGRRQQIIDTAAGLFAERGFHRVTVDEIGDAVGVSGPALYHHFSSKEELLGAMLVDVSQRLLEGGRARAAQGAVDAVDSLLAFHVDFAIEQPALITVHFRELVHAPKQSRDAVRRLQGAYVEVWVDVLTGADPRLDRRTARASTHAVLGLINSTPYSSRLGRVAMRRLLIRMGRAALASAPDED